MGKKKVRGILFDVNKEGDLYIQNSSLYLSGYKHYLPSNFIFCENLFLCDVIQVFDVEFYLENPKSYNLKLPNSLLYCNGSLYLNNYQHELPENFKYCKEILCVVDYRLPLPKKFEYDKLKCIECNKESKLDLKWVNEKYPHVKITYYC